MKEIPLKMKDIKKNYALQFYKRIPSKMNDIKKNYLHALEKSFKNYFPKYEFKNHCWNRIEDGIKLRMKISTDILKLFRKVSIPNILIFYV